MNYKLEFNEEQQAFHLSTPANRLPDSHGWWTIMDSCSDQMYWEFICMLETLHEKPYDRKKILNAQAKLAVFWDNLSKNSLLIVRQEKVQSDLNPYSPTANWVTDINQSIKPEIRGKLRHPFFDVLKKSVHFVSNNILHLTMPREDFDKIVNDFDNDYWVLPKHEDEANTPHTAASDIG